MKNYCQFSEDRQYRYLLEHHIDELQIGGPKRVMWIGLNPSTADEATLDPTLRRVRSFTLRHGGNMFGMTNLFAWRDTDPANMKKAADPIGPENDEVLLSYADSASLIICCWGAHGKFRNRASEVTKLVGGYSLFCLGLNDDGSPKHPLYLAATASLIPYP